MSKVNVSRLFVAVLIPLAAVALSACQPECVDKFDCRAQGAAQGVTLACVDNRCVVAPPEETPDAGEEVDAGEEQDAGEQDAGEIPDAGEADAGTDGGIGTDGGTPDSGTVDAGFQDAGILHLVASLTGTQEVPPVVTTDTGTADFILNLNAPMNLSYTINATGLTSQQIGNVDLRRAPAGVNGPLIFALNSTGQLPFTGTTTVTAAQADDLQHGRAYVQLHLQAGGADHLRGQVIQQGDTAYVAKLTGAAAGNPLVACNNANFDVPACGGVQVVLSADGTTIDYEGVWDPAVVATQSHIHDTISGNVAVPFALVTDGGQGVSGEASSAALDAGALNDGGYYVNVHTADAGSGLIRGTLVPLQ